VDTAHERAVEARAASLEAPTDQFYGERRGGVRDRWNNHWWIATRTEEVTAEELEQRELRFRRQAQQT
jgi:uncharacterized glyoxalase superfamily protein PhnB